MEGHEGSSMTIPSGVRYGPQIEAAASAHHLDPRLLAAVAAQETGGPGQNSGNNIVGDGGHGHGVFQIDDRSWPFASTQAAMDPAKNADVAAGILEDNLQRYGGDVHAALSAYNTGSPDATGTVTTWPDGETLGYADSVLRHYQDLGAASPAAASVMEASAGPSRPVATAQATAAAPAAGGSSAGGTTETTGAAASQDSSGSLDPAILAALSTAQTQQPPFATPLSWAQEMSANGAAGGNEASAADLIMADLVDPGDLDAHADDGNE
jgi:hypothetical protein